MRWMPSFRAADQLSEGYGNARADWCPEGAVRAPLDAAGPLILISRRRELSNQNLPLNTLS